MAYNKVEINGVNTSSLKTPSNDEMILLFKDYQKGNKETKNILVYSNLKLVLSILKRYQKRCDNMDDLFQIGCIGLIKAIDNFDLSHDVMFSTYAVPMIKGEIKRYLRDNTSIRVSRSIKDLSLKISLKKEELTSILGREPTNNEICSSLNINEYELYNAINSNKEVISMNTPIYNDGSDTIYLYDQLEDKTNKLYDYETKLALKEALNKIKSKEKYILLKRYIYGKTQVELSKELGISQAQISRLEKNAVNNIKKLIKY